MLDCAFAVLVTSIPWKLFLKSENNKHSIRLPLPLSFWHFMLAPTFKDSVSLLSLVTTVERAQVDEGEYFTSKTEITTVEEETEIIVEERKIREEEVWRIPEIPPPQTITERRDVIPRETPYVPPGIAKIPCAAFQNNFGSPVLYFMLACYIKEVCITACVKSLFS